VGSRKYRECTDSPSEPNYLGLGLYRPVLELNDPVHDLNYPVRDLNDPARELSDPARDLNDPARELNDPVRDLNDPVRELNSPAPELNDLDLELELFLKEPEESSISIRGLKISVKTITDLKTRCGLREPRLKSRYLVIYGYFITQSTILGMGKDIQSIETWKNNQLSHQHSVHPRKDVVNQFSMKNKVHIQYE
jgi:hypothetical protein